MEDYFSGIQTSAEYFTGEGKTFKGKQYERTSDRKLGKTFEEKRRKIIKLFALYAMLDAVKLHGEEVINSTPEDELLRIGKLERWLKTIISRGTRNAWINRKGFKTEQLKKDANHDVDAKLLNMMLRNK